SVGPNPRARLRFCAVLAALTPVRPTAGPSAKPFNCAPGWQTTAAASAIRLPAASFANCWFTSTFRGSRFPGGPATYGFTPSQPISRRSKRAGFRNARGLAADMNTDTIVALLAIALALGFDFVNGFHDTANAVATVIYTKALRPAVAIPMSGLLNFLGAIMV